MIGICQSLGAPTTLSLEVRHALVCSAGRGLSAHQAARCSSFRSRSSLRCSYARRRASRCCSRDDSITSREAPTWGLVWAAKVAATRATRSRSAPWCAKRESLIAPGDGPEPYESARDRSQGLSPGVSSSSAGRLLIGMPRLPAPRAPFDTRPSDARPPWLASARGSSSVALALRRGLFRLSGGSTSAADTGGGAA